MKIMGSKLNHLFIICILLSMTACVKVLNEDEIDEPKEGMSALIVPDGFNYENYYNSNLEITFPEKADSWLYFEVLNGSLEEGANSLFSDHFKGRYSKELLLPLHVKKLSVMATYKNRVKVFELNSSIGFNLALDPDSFKPSTDTTQAAAGSRTAGTTAKGKCLPSELGAYFPEDIWWTNQYILAYSDKDIDNVVLHYGDGSEVKFESPSINYGEIWYVEWDENKDLVGLWVKSGCNDSDDGPGYGWYVENPYHEGVIDTDNDGVEDALDDAPEDPRIASKIYFPARGEYNTLAFEDLWPYQGDFDFNDFVISINRTFNLDAENMVSGVNYSFKLRAIGASFNNDFCVGISDPSNSGDVSLTSESNLSMSHLHKDGWTEVRFNSIKDVFGRVGFVNTQSEKDSLATVRFEVSISLDQSVAWENFEYDEYLRINGEEGREVHLPGKAHTPWADVSMFQTGHDRTDPGQNKFYLTEDNLPWVIEIPVEWKYPKEGTQITNAYPVFKDFAQVDPEKAWYTSEAGNIVDTYIFQK